MKKYTGFEIAVIGMAGRFPKAENLERFWDNLKEGRDCISSFTDEEVIEAGEEESLVKDAAYVRSFGCLDGKNYFDAAFFNYRPDEAELMDPQIRIFHECCWEALENSGYSNSSYKDKIGVFASGSNNVNWELYSILKNKEGFVDDFTASHLRDVTFLSTRISYKLNLTGPAIFLQTGCSSSLVAIHQACNSLLWGECAIALAGGVTITNASKRGYLYREGMINSKDGKCRPFDIHASGTVGGEGAGVVVLKRLKDAIRDRDHIYAVIKGSGINNDGSDKVGYTAPGIKGQADAIAKAFTMAAVPHASIGYIEAHGTATELGDPVEIEALNKVFGTAGNRNNKSCAIGSVKSNIGHLDNAAGVAGFIKTVLAIKNKQIPASLNFTKANPGIDFSAGPFYVNPELKKWENNNGPLRAGVSSFGIGGTNAHVILEEAPEPEPSGDSRNYQLIVLSSKTKQGLNSASERLADYLKKNEHVNIADVAYTLKNGRMRFAYRKMFVCQNRVEAIQLLSQVGGTEKKAADIHEDLQNIIFMFSGQGAQYINMCKDLYLNEKIFKDKVDECLNIARLYSADNFLSILYPDNLSSDERGEVINNTKNVQPLLFVIEYSLACLLMHWGIRPRYMIGHSIGEYVAACLSGVFSLTDAMRLVIRRGELMSAAEKGSMLSINTSVARLNEIISIEDKVDIAVVNSPESLVVSGKTKDIEAFEKKISDQGFTSRYVHTSHAFHSYMMEEILHAFEEEVAAVTIHEPAIPYVSNITGRMVAFDEIKKPSYWSRHIRSTVQYNEGVDFLLQKGNALLIEVGPGRTLCNYVTESSSLNEGHQVLNLVRQSKQSFNDHAYLIGKLGQLWLDGITINWRNFYGAEMRNRLPLPGYSFEKTEFTADVDASKLLAKQFSHVAPAAGKDEEICMYLRAWQRSISPNDAIELTQSQGTFMIFAGKERFSELIADRLAAIGQKVIRVQPGPCFKLLDKDLYEIDYTEPGDYIKLWEHLQQFTIPVENILYCSALSDRPVAVDFETLEQKLDEGYLGLSYLAASFAAGEAGRKINVTVIANHLAAIFDNDIVDPLKAAIHGPANIMGLEMHHVKCKVIDIAFPFKDEEEKEDHFTCVLNEVFYDCDDPFVAYRSKERWVRSFSKLPQNGKTGSGSKIERDGVYIITGGFGGMGLTLATDIARNHGAHVILVHRSEFPQRTAWNDWLAENGENNGISKKIRQLQQIANDGGHVDLYRLDVSVEEQVIQFAKAIHDKYKKINGLIWAAGEVDYGGVILNRGKNEFLKYITSKVHGLLLFKKHIGFSQLDFVALFSSIGNVFYQTKFGQVAYNAANEFFEHFPYYESKHSGPRFFTINWSDWLDVGMTVKTLLKNGAANNVQELNAKIEGGISPREGISIFYRCLGSKARVVTIYKGNIADAITQLNSAFNSAKISLALPDEVSGAEPDDTTPERRLTSIFCRFFGKDEILPDDDFFELGGDSLRAMSLIARINKTFGTKLSIGDLYRHPTIREMLQNLLGAEVDTRDQHILNAPAKNCYELSAAQKRMYFLQQSDEGSVAYNETQLFWVHGRLHKDKLETAVRLLIARHETLRTSFVFENGIPMQVIDHVPEFNLPVFPYEELKLEQLVQSFIKPFDLARAPLYRVGVIERSENEHLIMIDSHHIITDGISNGILINDLMRLYNNEALEPLRLHYKDYAEWQQSLRMKEEMNNHKDFWLQQFSILPEPLELPIDFPRPPGKKQRAGFIGFELETEETLRLKQLAEKEGISMFMVLLSVFNILLSKLSNSEDIVIASPTSGRQHADVERMTGMFVNTLALRNYPKGRLPYKEFLAALKANTIACFDNQLYQFDDLVSDLKLDRDPGRNPLSDIMFVFENFDSNELTVPGLVLRPYKRSETESKFDICLTAWEHNENLFFNLDYSVELFKKETIERFAAWFKNIAVSVCSNAGCSISEIDMLSGAEKQQLLQIFNNTQTAYPVKETILSLFEQQVRATPDNIAVTIGDEKISYNELNRLSNRIAHAIMERSSGEGNNIGLFFQPSVELIAGILGVMKSGNVYVPLSPEAPVKRNRHILADCNATLLLMQESAFNESFLTDPLVDPDRLLLIGPDTGLSACTDDPRRKITPEQLIYIIYTSGTTGNPKGVQVKQKGVVNYILWRITTFGFTTADVTLQLSPYSFDTYGSNLYSALLSGGTLVLVEEKNRMDVDFLIKEMVNRRVTNSCMTPVLFGLIVKQCAAREPLKDLRLMVLAGEKASKRVLIDCEKYLPQVMLYNEYGPTEASIAATFNRGMNQHNTTIIGKPIANTTIHIVGHHDQLQPVGVPGEICIAGIGLALGYLNNENLTAEKFVDNPFVKGEKMYKTGDKAKWLPDGNIEFLGRIDNQVKVRGFRIELSEIEAQLMQYDLIDNIVVVARERDGDKYLIAYYIAAENIPVTGLRQYLLDKLPMYMVPDYFMRIEKMPVTRHGKLDVRALPYPEIKEITHTMAANSIEAALVDIWATVLQIDKEEISTTSSFFELGGNSFKVMQLNLMVKEKLNIKCSIPDMFRFSTIASFVGYVNNVEKDVATYSAEVKEEVVGLLGAINVLEVNK